MLILESSGTTCKELLNSSTIHISIGGSIVNGGDQGGRYNGTKWLFSSTIHVSIGRSASSGTYVY